MIRKSSVPDGGWNRETFARSGAKLIVDLIRISRYTQARRMQTARREIEERIRGQIERVLSSAETKIAKSGLGIEIDASQAFWDQVLALIVSEQSIEELSNVLKTHITSMLAQGYTKVSPLIDVPVNQETVNSTIPRRANQYAMRVRNISATTRARIQSVIDAAIKDGMTVRDTVAAIKKQVTSIAHTRAITIARTELNYAYSQGSILSFQQSGTITHVSVVGCDGVNDSAHFYQGRHTCNITDVPVEDAHLLDWHPNHRGTIVPSRFIG